MVIDFPLGAKTKVLNLQEQVAMASKSQLREFTWLLQAPCVDTVRMFCSHYLVLRYQREHFGGILDKEGHIHLARRKGADQHPYPSANRKDAIVNYKLSPCN